MASINTNLSAMTALQSLKSTQSSLNKTQSQISTGLRVGAASDNASYWSIATQMKSDNGALSAVKDSIGQSKAMIDTFTSAMDKSLTYLNKMKAGLVAATQPGADLAKIQTEFKADIEGMKSAAGSASFNGQNWLAQGTPGTVNLVTSYDGNTNTVGTLAIDTTKTNLFTDAAAGTGGLLGEVAAIDITGGPVDITVASTMAAGDRIEFNVGGSYSLAYDLTAADAADTDLSTLADNINADLFLQTQVSASVESGKLRITSLTGEGMEGGYLVKPASTGGAVAVANGGPGSPSTLTFDNAANGFDLTDATLSRGDRFEFTDGGTVIFTVGDETTLQGLADHINLSTASLGGVTAGVTGGKLVLTGPDDSFTSFMSGTYTHYTRTEGVGSSSPSDALAKVDEAIAKVTEGSSMLGANKALLETQEEFIGTLSDSLTAGVSAFVDADMNEASTRLQALQTQQQLGVQALSIANQNSQMILRLFQ